MQDWALGIRFGFARCQRQYGQKDTSFDLNMARMHALDMVAGGYEFALPMKDANGVPLTTLPDPAERARNSWRYFSDARPQSTDLYVLDLEVSPVGQDETNSWARAWYDEWVRVADRPPGIYLGSGYLTNRTGAGLREHGFQYLWYPRPSTATWDAKTWPDSFNPPPPKDRNGVIVPWAECAWKGPPQFHQFAFGGTYDGNLFNGTLEELRGLNSRG